MRNDINSVNTNYKIEFKYGENIDFTILKRLNDMKTTYSNIYYLCIDEFINNI